MAIRLYPKVQVKGLDFSKAKVHVVPNQCLSLDEIVRRYVRRLPLPVTEKEAYYEERFGDLEKLSKADPVLQDEYMESFNRLYKQLDEKFKDRHKVKMDPSPISPPIDGKEPVKSPTP